MAGNVQTLAPGVSDAAQIPAVTKISPEPARQRHDRHTRNGGRCAHLSRGGAALHSNRKLDRPKHAHLCRRTADHLDQQCRQLLQRHWRPDRSNAGEDPGPAGQRPIAGR